MIDIDASACVFFLFVAVIWFLTICQFCIYFCALFLDDLLQDFSPRYFFFFALVNAFISLRTYNLPSLRSWWLLLHVFCGIGA
jgi:hypothetical protein